jgi:uncharacterized protein (TIGR00730 family)
VLANHKIRLVYGAGKTGLMGAVAEGVLQSGGEVIGIVPRNLFTPQLIHMNLTELEVVADIHQRKARMSALSDGFISLPGGFGTFDELFETLTWAQIGLHHKPIGLLNTLNYFTPLLSLVQNAAQEGFIYPGHERLFSVDTEPELLLEKIMTYEPPAGLNAWVDRDDQG